MDKVRVVYKPDKTVVVIYPAPQSRKKEETLAQWRKRVFKKAMQGSLSGLPYDDMDILELPQNREDRDAWEGEKGKGIWINQEKAQELKENRIREEQIVRKIREIAIKALEEENDSLDLK